MRKENVEKRELTDITERRMQCVSAKLLKFLNIKLERKNHDT
ncbi:MAG: hypothetical protein NUV76_08495 [Candidatus Kuenenia sp.]|nr:hypothetical protein [Candidatus Kuenenia sp.]